MPLPHMRYHVKFGSFATNAVHFLYAVFLWWPVQWAFVALQVTWNKYDADDDDDDDDDDAQIENNPQNGERWFSVSLRLADP